VRRSQIAEVLMDMGRDKEALVHLEAAIPVFREQNNLNSLAISLAQSGEIYMREGHVSNAADAFMESVSVCQESDNIYIESRARNGLWQLYKLSDPRKAMVHLERYVELQAELNNDKATEQMQAFNVKYETLKKEQTIAMQKQRLHWAGVLVAMLVVLLSLASVTILLKVRAAKAVEQKNALLVKANIDKDRILALSRKNISKEVSTELEEIVSSSLDMPEIHLTAREIEIAELCAKGMINKEIAMKLGISQRTVETHKNNIFKKLGINNTVELMRYMQMRFASEQK
jgi:DNA-binding CsgD family transcriptional regulator